jgi:Colicin V production protein
VIIDIVIALVVVGAAWIGYKRGLVQPLLAEVLSLGTLVLILHNRSGFAAVVGALFHANAILAALVAVVVVGAVGYVGLRIGGAIHRMPAVRGWDGFIGVWLQALTGVAVCYLLISGIIVMGSAFGPILNSPTLSATQLAVIEARLDSNPFTGGLIDSNDLDPFASQARRPAGVRVTELPQIQQLQAVYADFLRPQLAGSHLAPFVMSVGRHIPGLGPYGPRDLPSRVPAPAPAAAPSKP